MEPKEIKNEDINVIYLKKKANKIGTKEKDVSNIHEDISLKSKKEEDEDGLEC